MTARVDHDLEVGRTVRVLDDDGTEVLVLVVERRPAWFELIDGERTIGYRKNARGDLARLTAPKWMDLGVAPRPLTRWQRFCHDVAHGALMRYPLRSVVPYAVLHALAWWSPWNLSRSPWRRAR